MAKWATDDCFSGTVCPEQKKYNDIFVTVNNDCLDTRDVISNDFHSWFRRWWKSLANHLTRDQNIVIHGNSCIILHMDFMINTIASDDLAT